jgi:hypothetical protein
VSCSSEAVTPLPFLPLAPPSLAPRARLGGGGHKVAAVVWRALGLRFGSFYSSAAPMAFMSA